MHKSVKVGQTLHMGGQYDPLDEPDVLYFTQIHQYGHMLWLWGYTPYAPPGGVGGRGRGCGLHFDYVCPQDGQSGTNLA